MGGSSSVLNPVGNNFLGGGSLGKFARKATVMNPQFLGGGMTGRVGRDVATMGLGEFTQQNPFGIPGNPIASVFGNGDPNSQNPYVSGPFSLDPAQLASDKAAIAGEGQKEYDQTLGGIDKFGTAQTQRAKDMFGLMLPNIAENAQAAHLYDSTGYGQEVARQQSDIASQVASGEAQQKQEALKNLQGFGQSGVGRQLSLEDFINQANVAKSIGAQIAPQVGNGKGQTGTALAGAGGAAQGAASLMKLGGKAAMA